MFSIIIGEKPLFDFFPFDSVLFLRQFKDRLTVFHGFLDKFCGVVIADQRIEDGSYAEVILVV